MARFDDLVDYFDPGLELTVRGKVYAVPLPSAELGLWCRAMAAASQLDDDSTDEQLTATAEQVKDLPPLPGNKTFPEHLLGPVYQQMISDKVEDPYIRFCAMTVMFWIIGGDDMAERYWKAGGRPEARGPGNRAERRAANARKTSTAGASATRSRASTSGTSTRRKSNANGTASRSRGGKS